MSPIRKISLFCLFVILFASPIALARESTPAKPRREIPTYSAYARNTAKIETLADQLEYSKNQKKIIARENVLIRYSDTEITADYAEVDTENKEAFARGHVVIYRDGAPMAHGEQIFYDFDNETGSFPDGRVIQFPYFITGEDIQQIRKGVKVIRRAKITTCDFEKPHYTVDASKVTVYDGSRMIARNIWIKVLGKPIFWWPYFVFPLQKNNLPVTIEGGYNSKFGAFVLVSKGISITKQIFGKIHADYRAKRGFGGGADIDYDYGQFARGRFLTYLTQDERAPTPGLENPFGEIEERMRGRVTWLHRTNFNADSHLILRYNRMSDEFFLQDFFEREYHSEQEPQSFATLTHNTDHYGFLTHVEKRMNEFERIVERLPEVRLDWKNQPFFTPGLYYQNHFDFANLNKRFGRSETHQDVVRYDQFNEWARPLKWNEFKLTPFATTRETYYTRERESTDDRFRMVLGAGADLRTHYYKTYSGSFYKWGIEANGFRHVVEPSIQYQTVKSTVSDETLHEFDPVDRIDDSDIVTFGIENRLQTKRVLHGRMQRVDLVSLNTFLSYEVHPDGRSRVGNFTPFDEDGRISSNFTILSQEVILRPYEWLKYQLRYDYDMERDKFRIFNQDLLATVERYRFLFGHRFVNDIGTLEGSNQFVFDGRWIINPLWEVGGYIRWNSNNLGLQEWQLSASRDLHDFVLDFGYNVRNSRLASNNKELFFNFRFKALPIIAIRQGGQRASFEPPRIGETVSGSNQ